VTRTAPGVELIASAVSSALSPTAIRRTNTLRCLGEQVQQADQLLGEFLV
jgi:hypothetical protein